MYAYLSTIINLDIEKYLASDESLSTVLIIFALALKLFINREVTSLQFKKTIISFPSEITFLVIGFLLANLVEESSIDTTRITMFWIVFSFIIIILQYAAERWIENKISGKFNFSKILFVLLMYSASLFIYCKVVFGGAL